MLNRKRKRIKTKQIAPRRIYMYRFEYEMCIVFYFFINETLNTSDFKPTSTENRPVKKSILPGNTYIHVFAITAMSPYACLCV